MIKNMSSIDCEKLRDICYNLANISERNIEFQTVST